MIKTVILSEEGMVLVFDKRGRQMPDYQGEYDEVRKRVLADALLDTLFWYEENSRIKAVNKENW